MFRRWNGRFPLEQNKVSTTPILSRYQYDHLHFYVKMFREISKCVLSYTPIPP